MQHSAARYVWYLLRICVACSNSFKGMLFTNIVKHYYYTTWRIDAIYLNEGKRDTFYKASLVDIYIDYVIWCFTKVQYKWYKPLEVCNSALDTLMCSQTSHGRAAVLLVQTWNMSKSITLYRRSNHLLGDQHPMERVGLKWSMGPVLDFRIGPCNFTAITNELFPGAGALSPRELIVLYSALNLLPLEKAVALLGAPSVTASIVLDGTLQEITALDNTPIAAAE